MFAAMCEGRIIAGIVAGMLSLLASSGCEPGIRGRVYASAEDVQPLAAGERVPSVQVTGLDGDAVDLADLVREHGALLVFYRGGW